MSDDIRKENDLTATGRRNTLRAAAATAAVAMIGAGIKSKPADAQSVAWKQSGNNQHVLALQDAEPHRIRLGRSLWTSWDTALSRSSLQQD